MKNNPHPKLTVVGAGPGDPELITLKAVKAIRSADVILYDALVNPELLDYNSTAEKLFVGKRKGCYAYHQDQINELIVAYGASHGHVVRLKGGDPFVFGRGAEEMQYAASFGMETEMVPGISSALAVPATQDIPVTKRGCSESFWVITATTKSHELSQDIYDAAKSKATVVILMGMHKLEQIISIFTKEGKADIPVAIIQNGTREEEKTGIGTIATISSVVKEKELRSPAIIVIGDVVGHSAQLKQVQFAYANR